SNNINQVAKKANETNNIYAGDVEKLKGEVAELCHTLSRFLSTPRWTRV
ncbi:MAG: plasmid mobilization relaxosome protein MobC, partial [Ruminococcus sp.]|nr:plasmid mobilization relaxosome protein MobC [Ruminococcus sp.]